MCAVQVLIKNVGFGLQSSTENYDEDFQFTVIAYYWSQFENVRKSHGISEDDFELSLARCFQWKPRGGKSKAYFAKSFDERFVIKEVYRPVGRSVDHRECVYKNKRSVTNTRFFLASVCVKICRSSRKPNCTITTSMPLRTLSTFVRTTALGERAA